MLLSLKNQMYDCVFGYPRSSLNFTFLNFSFQYSRFRIARLLAHQFTTLREIAC